MFMFIRGFVGKDAPKCGVGAYFFASESSCFCRQRGLAFRLPLKPHRLSLVAHRLYPLVPSPCAWNRRGEVQEERLDRSG